MKFSLVPIFLQLFSLFYVKFQLKVCSWSLSSAGFWVQLASQSRDGGEGRILYWHLLEPAPSLGLGGLGNKNALLAFGQEASCGICLFLKGSRVSGRVVLCVNPIPAHSITPRISSVGSM